jgi:hypothetical protein
MQPATNPLALVFAQIVLWPSVIPRIANATVSTGFSLHDTGQALGKCRTTVGRMAIRGFFFAAS